MCRYLVLAVPADADEAAVRRSCTDAGFAPSELPFTIALKQLPGPALYLRPTSGACDCDEIIGKGSPDDALEREERRLRSRGWSEAKLARWRIDKEAARRRHERTLLGLAPHGPDRSEAWIELLESVRAAHDLPWVALSPVWLGDIGLIGRGDRRIVKTTEVEPLQLRTLRDSDVLVLQRAKP